LRVGLRRLRSALRELAAATTDADPRWDEALAQLFARLGSSRDRDALAQTLLPAMERAGAGPLHLPATDNDDPATLLRAPATTLLWLELIAFAAGEGNAEPQPFKPLLRERLAQLHKQVRRDAKRFAALDDPARHRLRKRLKRLRYLCEFGASMWAPKPMRAFLKLLGPVQDALGHYNDVCVARALFDTCAASDSAAMFARGWLARERDDALQRCLEVLPTLRRARVGWR
jgi:CHAD domain-containing protein